MHPVELKIVRPGAVCDAEFYRIFSLCRARLRLPKPDPPGALQLNRFQRQPLKLTKTSGAPEVFVIHVNV